MKKQPKGGQWLNRLYIVQASRRASVRKYTIPSLRYCIVLSVAITGYDKNSTVFVKSAQRFFSTYQHEDDGPTSSEANRPFPSDNGRMVTANRDDDGYKDSGQASMTAAAIDTHSDVVHTAEERPTPSKESFFKKPENRIAKYIGSKLISMQQSQTTFNSLHAVTH